MQNSVAASRNFLTNLKTSLKITTAKLEKQFPKMPKATYQNEFQRPQTDLETARTRFDRLRMPKYINHARGNKFGDMKQKLKKCIVYGTAVKNQPKQHESEIEK